MRTRYIIAYDVSDPRRLRKVFKIMKGAGDHIQLSVFRCDLSERQLEVLKEKLSKELNLREDQVLLIELGPTESRMAERISSLGRICEEADGGPVIV